MKWLLVIAASLGGLVALAVIVLLALGSRSGAGGLQAVVEIDRPPSEVFGWLNEPDKLERWVSWLVEVKQTDPGPRKVGSRQVWVMDDPNTKQKMEISGEVTEYEPARKLSTRLQWPQGFDGRQTYTLTGLGVGDRTRLEHHSQYNFHHWFAKLLKPLIRSQAQKKLVADLARLKSLTEATPRTEARAAPAAP